MLWSPNPDASAEIDVVAYLDSSAPIQNCAVTDNSARPNDYLPRTAHLSPTICERILADFHPRLTIESESHSVGGDVADLCQPQEPQPPQVTVQITVPRHEWPLLRSEFSSPHDTQMRMGHKEQERTQTSRVPSSR